jgi:hypothetical protein
MNNGLQHASPVEEDCITDNLLDDAMLTVARMRCSRSQRTNQVEPRLRSFRWFQAGCHWVLLANTLIARYESPRSPSTSAPCMNAAKKRTKEIVSLKIESDVERNVRTGFGVIAVSEAPAVCVINSTPLEQIDGIKELLRRNQYLIAPKLTSDWQYVDASADLAFRGLQRQQCGYVAGGADDLRSIARALHRGQMEYRFVPVWFEVKDVEQATFDTRDAREQEIRKKAEKDRALKDQAALEEKRLADKQRQKSEIELGLRQKNGAKADSDHIET